MSRRLSWGALLLGSLLSLAVSYGLAAQSLVLGSHDGNWVYNYIRVFSSAPLGVFGIVAVCSAALLAASPADTRYEWTPVVAWCLAGLWLQGLIRSVTPFTFQQIFVSDTANSFYSPALRLDAAANLGGFEKLRSGWPLHAQSNLPGKLLLVRGLLHITIRPRALAWLVVAISNMGGVLLYIFVRDLLSDRRTALFSVVLYLFTPAKLFFFPLLNTITPVLVLACACLLQHSLRTGRTISAALFGVSLYALIIYEPTALAIGLLFAAMAATSWRSAGGRRIALETAIAALAFAATYFAVFFWSGFDLLHAVGQVGRGAGRFNIEAGRPYWIWVRQNLVEFAFGVGVCQAVLFWAALGESRFPDPMAVLCLALLAALLVTDLIGVNRGEVIRLWLFLACFFQIPAAYVCARLESRAALGVVLGTTLLQSALGTAMVGFVVP
jgi:hypothetical protein